LPSFALTSFELASIADRAKVHLLAVDHVVGQRQQRIARPEVAQHRHLAEPLLGDRRFVGRRHDMSARSMMTTVPLLPTCNLRRKLDNRSSSMTTLTTPTGFEFISSDRSTC
jgi:hypothetical protein